MEDDFNTAGALGHLFDLVKAINASRASGSGSEDLMQAQAVLRELSGVLGLRLEDEGMQTGAGPFIDLLIEIRQSLREAGQFELADQIRERLAELDVTLEDSKGVTTWRQA